MWGGAMTEFVTGLYAGTKNVKSVSYTIFLMIYVSLSTYILYRCINLDFWGCYVIVQFVGTSDTAQYYVGKNFGSIRIFPVKILVLDKMEFLRLHQRKAWKAILVDW